MNHLPGFDGRCSAGHDNNGASLINLENVGFDRHDQLGDFGFLFDLNDVGAINVLADTYRNESRCLDIRWFPIFCRVRNFSI